MSSYTVLSDSQHINYTTFLQLYHGPVFSISTTSYAEHFASLLAQDATLLFLSSFC